MVLAVVCLLFLLQCCHSTFAFSPPIKPIVATFAPSKKVPTTTNTNNHLLALLEMQRTEENERTFTPEAQTQPQPQNEEEYNFDSLDVMLTKARKRKMVLLPYKIQAIANKPIINLFNKSSLNLGECMLIFVAIKLGSIGFCVGYVIGKVSTRFLRGVDAPIVLVELWTVLLAVGLDVVWNNLF